MWLLNLIKAIFIKKEIGVKDMEFNDVIDKVLEHEGGYVNDPSDLGGETKYGISKRAYPDIDIKSLTKEDAKDIYKRDYWDKNKVGSMPEQLRYLYFDMCINMGPRNAGKILQRAANGKNKDDIVVDGKVGPATIAAVSKVEEDRLRSYRVLYYANLVIKKPEQEKFWFGWFRRSLEV